MIPGHGWDQGGTGEHTRPVCDEKRMGVSRDGWLNKTMVRNMLECRCATLGRAWNLPGIPSRRRQAKSRAGSDSLLVKRTVNGIHDSLLWIQVSAVTAYEVSVVCVYVCVCQWPVSSW